MWFDGPVNIDADALLGHVDGDRGNKDEAAEWLTDLLAVGPLGTGEIKKAAAAEGYSWATLRRAQKLAGVTSRKQGFDGGWTWSLPSTDEGAQPRDQQRAPSAGAIKNAVFGSDSAPSVPEGTQPATWAPSEEDNPDTAQLNACADAHADPEVVDERTAIMEFEAEESRQVATRQ